MTENNQPNQSMSPALKRLVLLLVTVGVLAVGSEVITRVVVALQGGFPPVADESLANEWRWASAHLAAGRAVIDSPQVYDAWTGWRNKPNYKTPDIQTNSAGLRARREYSETPPAGKKRLLLLGDSYTFGFNVRDDETFARFLEAELMPGWEVLNMGVPGSGTDQQLILFEREGRRYHPNVVLLGFFVRDYPRNTLWFRDYAKPRFVSENGGFKLVGSPVIPPEQLFQEYVTGRRKIGAGVHSYALGALARFQRVLSDRKVTAQSEGAIVLSGIMARFATEVRAAGATPLWMIIPDRDVLGKRARHDPVERLSEQYAAGLRLPCLSLSKVFREWSQAHPDQKIYQGRDVGGHLSPAGNRLVAEEIRRFLIREGVLKSEG